jgi:hypothetical protein
MNDPFEILRDELATAATRPVARQPGRRRALWIAVAGLLVAGVASAAVVAVTGSEHSQPLAGRAPGLAAAGVPARYRIVFYPRLAAGHADWCWMATVRSARGASGGSGCGPAAPRGAALIAGGGMGSPEPGRKSLNWLVVDGAVALVRLTDGRTIRPRADPMIPYGWRSVVWFGTGLKQQPRLLDAHGRQLPLSDLAGTRSAGTMTLATATVNPYSPGPGCAIRVPHRQNIRALQERVVSQRLPRGASINARAFRACAVVAVTAHGVRYRAALLTDASNPQRRAAPLPGMPAHAAGRKPTLASGNITARRVGRGWLAVKGPNPHQRLLLLRRLQATPPQRESDH